MACLSGSDGNPYRFQIAHLAQQDHVRGLSQRRAKGAGEGGHVVGHVALADQGLLVIVYVFDRVLNGHDVTVALGVDAIHHTGQRGALAASGRAGDQDHAVQVLGQLHHQVRDAQRPGIGQAKGHHSAGRCHGAALHIGVAAKAAQARQREGEVIVALLVQLGDVAVGHLIGLAHQRLGARGLDDIVGQGHHIALDLAGHVRARYDEYIRTAQFIGLAQYLSQFHTSSVTAVSRCSRQRSRSFSPWGNTSTAQLSVRRPSESSQLTIRSSWPISMPSGRLPRTAAR